MADKKRTATATRLEITAGLFRFSVAQFLVALVVLLVAYPFVTELDHGYAIESAMLTVLLISAVLAVSGRTWGLAILLVLPALAALWMEQVRPGLAPLWVLPCARMIFVGYVVLQLLRFIARAKRVNSEILCAGISAYLLLGLFWSSAYLMEAQLNPDSFSSLHPASGDQVLGRFDALYLSYVTLTCVGCGDIMPLSKVARMFMALESLTGVLYLAVMIARLVSMYSRAADNESKDP